VDDANQPFYPVTVHRTRGGFFANDEAKTRAAFSVWQGSDEKSATALHAAAGEYSLKLRRFR